MMNAKQWLGRVQYIDRRIEAKAEQAMRIRARLEGRRAILSDMPRGGSGDWTDALANLIALEQEIDQEIDGLIIARREIVKTIDALPDERMRTLLELRYLNGWGWQRVADALHYDRRSVTNLHCAALQLVDKTSHNFPS